MLPFIRSKGLSTYVIIIIEQCKLTYDNKSLFLSQTTETIHAAVYMALAVSGTTRLHVYTLIIIPYMYNEYCVCVMR